MFWDNANKPVLELLRNSWNSWTPWTSEIMQINRSWTSYIHWIVLEFSFWYILEMQKVTFSMCILRCSGILNFWANYIHTDSGKTQKSQGKLFFPFSLFFLTQWVPHYNINTNFNENYEQQKFVFYVFVI